MSTTTPAFVTAARKLADERDADVFMFSEAVDRNSKSKLCRIIETMPKRRKNVVLILTTNGGDPAAAYLIARYLKQSYAQFHVYIFGLCKSSGTLIVLGADSIVMSGNGELGPLDIQLGKDDEVYKRSSGLDLTESLSHLKELSWDLFKEHFMALKRGSSITTKTAAEIAQSLTATIITPIANQIDPLRLGEVQRAMRITRDYAQLLNPQFEPEKLNRLIVKYPSHDFVIDLSQAKEIFPNVRAADAREIELAQSLRHSVAEECQLICLLSDDPEPETQNENEAVHSNGGDYQASAPTTTEPTGKNGKRPRS